MAFTVDNFQNPYNGVTKQGFVLTTFDANGVGMIDQSEQLSVIVTEFAALSNPSLTRADTVTTVGEQSSLTLSFSLNLPVDANCRLRIIFPVNQAPTFALNTATGTNLFSGSTGIGTINIANREVEINGCFSY